MDKNSKDKIEIWKEFMDKIGKDEVANIFKKMVDDGNEDFMGDLHNCRFFGKVLF